MRHHLEPGRACLPDDDCELLLVEAKVLETVERGHDASRRRDLDHLRARSDHLADAAAHTLRPVDDRARAAGVLGEELDPSAGGHPAVAVAAGLAQHRDRDLEPRPADEAFLDGELHAEVGAACVADGRDPDPERRLEIPDRLVKPVGERRLDQPPQVDVAEHDVDVCVE
jgi:hypothetical protein